MTDAAAKTSPANANGLTPSDGSLLGRARTYTQRKPLLPLLAGGAMAVAIIVALLLWAGGPDYKVLYSNLSESDGGRIISALEQRGVPYRFAQGGHALLVPSDQVYALRLRLAEQGLPSAGNVGLDIMDKQPFGISQFTEQINYQRGLQGELATSIESLQPVAHARVHLALPKDSLFVRERQPTKATVVLTLQPGRALGDGQVNAIVHLVSSSVRDLAAENVTVVDQDGRLLTHDGADGDLNGTQLAYQHEVENRYQQRIEKILTPILGAGNVHAQVTAQIDFSRREETDEHYAPNQGDNPASVRSLQTSMAQSRAGDGPGGVPGALSNTPPGAAASPINNPPAGNPAGTPAAGNAAAPVALATASEAPTGDSQRETTTNYEVDRNITHTKHSQGGVQRLSVAVVVNYLEQKEADGSQKQVPIGDAEMKQITSLTQQAMGYSTQRGDTLEVVNSAFSEVLDPLANQKWWQQTDWVRPAMSFGRYLLVLLAAWLLYRKLLKPVGRQLLAAVAAKPAVAGAAQIAAPGQEPDIEPMSPRRPRNRASTYEQGLQDLGAMAKDDPGMVAMILRSWLNRNDE